MRLRSVARLSLALWLWLCLAGVAAAQTGVPTLAQGGDELGVRPAARHGAAALPAAADDPAWARWQALPAAVRNKVDPRILAELRGEVLPAHLGRDVVEETAAPRRVPLEKTRFLVYLSAQAALGPLEDQVYASQADRRAAVAGSLMATAQGQQAAVRSLLDDRMAGEQVDSYQPFFIVNALAVEGDLDTLIDLALRPDVARIAANYPLVPLFEMGRQPTAPAAAPQALSPQNWNIDRVDADRVWSELAVRGEGAVVAGFDTGVTLAHPALASTYRGRQADGVYDHNYSWFEPDSKLYPDGDLGPSQSAAPYDCDFWSTHGTHTMGTMVGDGREDGRQVGMAPAARWIAVPGICSRTMSGGLGDDIGGLKAFQWLLCPTDLTGNWDSADCSRAPDVVNNSWGSANPANDIFRPAIQALRAAGIAPVFAAGNPTAGAGSISSPANAPEAIAVGAVDRTDELAIFSGRGPSVFPGERKPELAAPGVDVLSSVERSSYRAGSGTSMAAPHVAGLVALMVAADLRDGRRDFDVDELERFMQFTAVDLGSPGPDDAFGYGRIDAYSAVRWALTAGDLAGLVKAAGAGTPIAGATITGRDAAGHPFTATTAAGGAYSATVPGGSYDVAVAAWGYQPATFAGQQVFAGLRAIADFTLAPLPVATLQGHVRAGGVAVADADIFVDEHPATRTRSAGDGSYTLALPVGDHTLVVQRNGYRTARARVTVAAGGASRDVDLAAAPTVLLVDADAYAGWFYGWPALPIFRQALDERAYAYDVWRVEYTDFQDTKVLANGATGYGLPSAATLARYRAVIWVHTGCGQYCGSGGSPGDIGAADILKSYLDGGGRLIVSGQDIGYWDNREPFYRDYLRAELAADTAAIEGDAIAGSGFLEGVHLTVSNATLRGHANGSTSLWPDAVQPADGAAYSVLVYDNQAGHSAGLAVAPCDAGYRALYLAVGLENVGPRTAETGAGLAELLDRGLAWVTADKAAAGVSLSLSRVQQSGAPGTRLLYDLLVTNVGQQAVAVHPTVDAALWPTRLLSGTAGLGSAPIAAALQLAPCGSAHLTLEVTVPLGAALGSQDEVTVTADLGGGAAPATARATSHALDPWQMLPDAPTSRYRLGVAALDDRYLYAVGGWYNNPYSYDLAARANERYDICSGAWETMAPLPVPLTNGAVVALGGKVMAVGGASPVSFFFYARSSAVYVYDPALDRWDDAAPLPVALDGIAAAAAGGKLYVFGGYTGSTVSAQTLEYDPHQNAWRTRRPMPGGGRVYAAAAALDGKIYVAGGWPALTTVDVYDPRTDSWSTAAPMLRGRHSFGLATTPDGTLIASGGGNGWQGLERAERFDPARNAWEIVASLKDANRAGSAAAQVGGLLLHVGGSGVYRGLEALTVGAGFCQSTLRAAGQSVVAGERMTVTVQLEPDRGQPVDATLRAGLPAGVRFDGFVENAVGAIYLAESRSVEWAGRLAASGAAVQVRFATTPLPQAWPLGGVMTYTAQFGGADGRTFGRIVETAVVLPQFASSVKQAERDSAIRGEPVGFSIRLESSTAAGGSATVRDLLPPALAYVPGSLTYEFGAGSYDAASHTIRWQGAVPAGANIQVNTLPGYAWGDSDGNGTVQDVTFDWIDISATGAYIGYDDVYACDKPLGFAFSFFGLEHNTFCASGAGYLSFDRNGYSSPFNECPLPARSGGALIAGIWSDLDLRGGIFYQQFGQPPHRYTVVQWVDAVQIIGGAPASRPDTQFQIIMYEDGNIKVQVLAAGAKTGAASTTGLAGYSVGQGLTYACNRQGSLHDRLAILFVPPGGSAMRANTTLHYRAVVADDAPYNVTVTNTAVIQGDGRPITRTAAVELNPVFLNTSTLAVEPATLSLGQIARFRFRLINTGRLAATAAELRNVLPAELSFVDGSLTCSLGACSFDQGAVAWRGTLAPAAPVDVEFSARLAASLADGTPVENVAVLDDGQGGTQRLSAVLSAQRMELANSVFTVDPAMAEPGSSVHVIFFVRNGGRGSGQARLTVDLPAGLVYQADSLACGSGACALDDLALTWQGAVDGFSVIQVRLRATLPAGTPYGTRFVARARLTDESRPAEYDLQAGLMAAHSLFAPFAAGSSGGGDVIYLPLISGPRRN